ncbi:MAG TPA: urease subunit gamma [Nitrolancea sp.]|jgi:urease gamma subunit|nr:urease subunit gamma [Nitrolancea sp.]
MLLTPKEIDRLTVFTLAELARRRQGRGIKLNHPEATAIICDEIFEEARAGRSYDEVVARASGLLTRADVMDGVAEMLTIVQVDAMFSDGTRLVTVRNPIQ